MATGPPSCCSSVPRSTSVTALTDTDANHVVTTYSAGDLLDLAIYPRGRIVHRQGIFTYGYHNISVTYKSGLATVPGDLKRAALMVCVRRLAASDIPWESASGSFDGGINWTMTIDPTRNRWYGNDRVDGVLMRYRRVLPGVA